VSPTSLNLIPEESEKLTAETLDAEGKRLDGRLVTWTSSRADVAAVDQKGVVTGVAVGDATVTAESEGKSGTAAIVVSPPPVASATVHPRTAPLTIGDAVQLAGTALDSRGKAGPSHLTIRPVPAADVRAADRDRQTAFAGTTLPIAIAALVTDVRGKPVPGVRVVWTVPEGGGSVEPASGDTGPSGRTSTSRTLGLEPGAIRVLPRADGVDLAVGFTATANAPALTASLARRKAK